jgi:hypothetical protein
MILALAEKHRGRQPTRRRCHTRGAAGIPGARDLGMGTLFFTGTDGEITEIERLTGIS